MADGAALRSTAWVLSGLSVWALSMADYVAHRGKKVEHLSDENPFELGLFIIGACALMWSAPLAQLAGWRMRRDEGFKLIQFFAGGLPSVLIQAFAWSCYATAVFASVMSLLNPNIRLRGLKTGLGLLGVAAQALVNVSVDLFEGPVKPVGSGDKKLKKTNSRFTLWIVVTSALAFITTLIGLALTLLTEIGFFTEQLKPTTWNLAMACFTVAVISMIAARGRESSASENEVIQVAKLFALLLYGAAVWIYLRLRATPSYAALKGSTVGFGIVGTVSSILSMYSLLYEPELVDRYNASPRMETQRPSGEKHTSIIYQFSLTLLVLSFVSRFYSTMLAAVMSIVGAPLAHLGAWLVYRLDDGFHLARALQGGATFSVFQGVGWMAYALALLGVFVFAVSSDLDVETWGRPSWDDAGDFLHPIVFIAHLSLLWSKQVFRRVSRQTAPFPGGSVARKLDMNETVDSQDGLPAERRSQADEVTGSHLSNGKPKSPPSTRERVQDENASNQARTDSASITQAKGSSSILSKITLGFVALFLISQLILPELPQVSISISVVAAMHVLIRTPAPFSGSATVIVQQALGWTLFIVSLVAQLLLIYNNKTWVEYEFLANLVRAFGLIVLANLDTRTGTSSTSSSAPEILGSTPNLATPVRRRASSLPFFEGNESASSRRRSRKKTDEEMSLDLRELDALIDQAKRPTVLAALQFARKQVLEGSRPKRRAAVILGLACIAAVHVNLALNIYIDAMRLKERNRVWTSLLFALDIAMWGINAMIIHIKLGMMLHGKEGYKFYQPFRGGVFHVVFQAMGWTLLVVSTISNIVCFNYGISKIELDGLLSGLGLGSYTGSVLLLASLAQFDSSAPHLGFAFDLGWFLSAGALLLFLGVDVAIVKFGLQDASLLVPVIVCAWVAVALSVPLAYLLEQQEDESKVRRSRFGVIRVAALAVWTFSMFLTLFLIGRAATLSSSVWLSSTTGVASVLAQGMMAVSSDTARSVLFTQQIAFLIMTAWFLYLVMPTVRAFLDGPMWYYAYFFKTWRHSRSPDGRHPLERTRIWRNVSFGTEMMDVMAPCSECENEEEDKLEENGSEENQSQPQQHCQGGDSSGTEDEHPPVVYMHGGGHIFVKREVLAHQVTPLCRVGAVVYSVEYPLSPESRFPSAVVCVLQALKWIKQYHCRGGSCVAGLPPKQCRACEAKGQPGEPVPADFPCRCCPHRRGANVVQLLGDSAGGNLAALATALLCNPHLLEVLAPFTGHDDFTEWNLPKVQRLCVVYGLLGRNLFGLGGSGSDEEDTSSEDATEPTWTQWIVQSGSDSAVSFILNQYAGPNLPGALRDKVVLNDLGHSLVDFAPETLLLCGTYDPLVATNRQALRLIRQQTGRECRLVEYEGSIHGFAGWPVQWSLGRWLKDAYPATCEMVQFFTGGKRKVAAVDLSQIPADYSPIVVFPLVFLGMAFVFRLLWAAASILVNFMMYSVAS